jgi:hypothetical protein
MENVLLELIENSQKNLKWVKSKYMDGNSYRNEEEWIKDVSYIEGRIGGYKRVLELIKENK